MRQQPGLTPGFSRPPQLPEPAGGRQGPNLCGGKCISLTETGQALGWVPGGRGSVLQDTDVPPSSPRSSRVKAVGLAGRAGLAEEVGWSESPESLLRPLSETLLPDSGGGALLLLLSSSSSASWGFYKTDKGTALGVRRRGLHPAEYPPAHASGIRGKARAPGTQHPRQ